MLNPFSSSEVQTLKRFVSSKTRIPLHLHFPDLVPAKDPADFCLMGLLLFSWVSKTQSREACE